MHPVLLHLEIDSFSVTVYAYGTMLMLAIISGWLVALPGLKNQGFLPEKTLVVVFIGMIGALIMARSLYVLTNWGAFRQDLPLSFLDFNRRQGLVAYGGYLGGFLTSFLVTRVYDWSWFSFADAAAPALASGLALTRVGCFLAGCDYGLPTTAWMGIAFPKDSFAYTDHLARGLINRHSLHSLPVHPTQLYAVAAGLLICFLLLAIHKKFSHFQGVTFASFLLLYGVFRFNVEFFRGDADRGLYWGLSTSQWLALTTVIWGLWILKNKLCNNDASHFNKNR
jgi:phosphatidylglycerol:prolipoprotein diacylglycerol transferase